MPNMKSKSKRTVSPNRRGIVPPTPPPKPDPFPPPPIPATVSKLRDKYFLTLGKRKVEIPVGPVVSGKDIDKLVGKKVYAVSSRMKKSEIVAIGMLSTPVRNVPCYWIICYIPAVHMISKVDTKIRESLVTSMLKENIITSKFAKELRFEIRKKM